ncbi:unnamed protein product [Rotaria magnacalcarata]|uniref:SecA family profile domain-containing protein n=1 Tax=Rotaria magnacalcarata TaxID=392030 RepID=A0A815HYS3_9BILA|nr:unnamed protein product [Rotaria magnacalcarata]CAF1539711.1 unnamed protein product [Rotaria magnacalcarata]CAF3874263.1 unnamed protein product [Rotaria magnacalcarata]CAF3898423.1 unnamed protein product [Rotaria magnacalcarata]
MKHKNNDLISYYLNDLKILKDLLKENGIRDAYEESIRFVSENITEYCNDSVKKFNRALSSQDGLREKDISDYQTSIKYIENAQILKEQLESRLVSPAILIQNIVIELNRLDDNLNQDDLNLSLIMIYLDNFSMLKNSFKELEENYCNSCRKFEKRFDKIVQTVHELIPKHDFQRIAELLLNIFQFVQALKNHLPSRVHELYGDIIKYILQYLCNLSEKVEPLLVKARLSDEEVEIIKKSMGILRSAVENAVLQEHVSKYVEMVKRKTRMLDEHDISQAPVNNTKYLNEIYYEFVAKVIKHFDEISLRIKELFDRNGDHTLEYIKTLVSAMDTLRTIPEVETRTAGTYYRTIENIRGYMEQLQSESEKLLIAIDQQSDITSYRNLARLISRLKTTEWINQASPGTYETVMHRITEDLVQYACQLEDSFMKIDFSLKCPENVSAAKEIVKKIESMRHLEQSIPELKSYTEKILQRFLRCTQEVFDRIQKTFNLQDKDVYKIKQKLKELEEIKREYNDLHPTRIYLHKNGYSNIGMLSNDIEELKAKKKLEMEAFLAARCDMESELQNLDAVVRKYVTLSPPSSEQGMLATLSSIRKLDFQNDKSEAKAYLKSSGYSSIESVYEKISNIQKNHHRKLQRIEDQNAELSIPLDNLESIKKEYDLLVDTRHSSSEQANFLQGKGFDSYELLDESIQEKERISNARGTNQQSYHFSDRLDASVANNALVYISQCETVSCDSVRKNATDANENLRRYIREYGIFLKQEINTKFNYMRTVGDERDPFLYSQDLEMRLQELSSFNKFPEVFKYINAAETIDDLQQEFFEYHRTLNSKMEECRVAAKIKELRDQVIIAQKFTSVDRFCVNIFAGNGFSALYRQYQGEIHKECRIVYKTVLDHILKGDYANADMALTDIQDKPLNERDKAQIQNDLYCSLSKLMKDTISITNWLDGKIEREDNRDQIMKIKENIEKIRIARNKHMVMELLDEKTQTDLKKFDDKINEILCKIILKGLNSIAAFTDADSFSEAEQGMETLSRVQRELAGYCVSTEVIEKSDELRVRLDQIVTTILERKDFEDFNKYSISPPKDLLAKLKIVASHGSARYVQAHNTMEGKIRQTFNLAIDQVHKAPLNERSAQIRSLKYALCFLPDDLQGQFKSQIDELSNLIADEVTAYKQDVEALSTHINENEHNIARLGVVAGKCSKENMNDLLKTLRGNCLKQLQNHLINIQKFFDEQNIQSAMDTIKTILKYEESVGAYISEMKGICNNIRDLIFKQISNRCNTLTNIRSIEQVETIEKAFSDILICLDFSQTSDVRIKELFSEEVFQNVQETFEKLHGYFHDNSEKFLIVLKDMDILELKTVMLISNKWQNLLEKINQCQLNHCVFQIFSKKMKNIVSFRTMISHIEQIINDLESRINVEFITDETKRFEVKREALFKNLSNTISTLRKISISLKDIVASQIDIYTCEKEIKAKVDKMKNQLLTKASMDQLSIGNADDFRTYYNHLLSFEQNVSIPGIDIRQILDESENKIMRKVNLLEREITRSISNVEAVATALINIKFYAENLSMFEKHINDQIDKMLKHYQSSQGSARIRDLSVELEKTDIGARLIGEHSSLSGEDWRKRREKMQKQDDLEYVIENLTGDDLVKQALSSRYKTYREKYNKLLSTFLTSMKPTDNTEPDLGALVTQTKLLVSTVKRTDAVIWNRAFTDNIPELVAYIAAIWTLKNTQHYNTMRGVDEADTYLLMPHVGQIIAIFRLLGLGYEKTEKIPIFKIAYKKMSGDLVNNLVELGTGEGKSVVLAITACVFALTGVDVNCSCYSEVLSTRDKNDFASVFRTLGIEDHIEYGTFNKLCEQLLNEQCNLRETVRNMIITNQSTLPALNTSTRTNSKVLLIDEVDVFLSDKYYGGIYIPSVYLKHATIKALIDSIWRDKTLRWLNSVKALPAYATCATQYSNWIFLFDEAIKDMLAALQSYQSSTYLVQNDRIVYVEGESIVDNVVRGYDTIWAYYLEHGKGNISQASLEENVGILINCGIFSYAEMPHDFSYIGGVTGTLKTLAKVEKNILETVYAINKRTFLPSVFGSSNRLYNSMTDVRVVNEKEYFMYIRDEIRATCNAKRAMLVFFESEEKLMTFYNSTELSPMKEIVQIIMEKVSVKDRDLYVKRAATIGKVTLLTRTFGRGTDFICRNQQLLVNGGIHVLQTFFSEELSEEYQIMGRGARQGDLGSYRMILLDRDLEWVLGSSWQEDLPKIIGTTLYENLDKARNIRFESKCGAKELGIKQCKADHKASKEFITALTAGNIVAVKTFLKKQNQGANLITASSRTLLLMDATGSMSGLLSATKETVCTMFERAAVVLNEKGLPSDAFQMQFVVYRDYDCKSEGILQSSSWETKPNNLRNFMTHIVATGGGDYEEAIEIGLWYAVQQSEQPDGISQVILIGDAPAKDMPAIHRDRQMYGGKVYWSRTKYKTPTHYTDELKRLKAKNIPVHAFYLAHGAKANFEKIASESLGRCERLNINSAQGAEALTNFVTLEVLRKTAGDQGNAAVELYRAKYMTRFTS